MKDKAIKMLLESTAATNPSEPLFYEYNLRACLAATCRSAPNDKSQNGKLKKSSPSQLHTNMMILAT